MLAIETGLMVAIDFLLPGATSVDRGPAQITTRYRAAVSASAAARVAKNLATTRRVTTELMRNSIDQQPNSIGRKKGQKP
jgi:hypothetical protein